MRKTDKIFIFLGIGLVIGNYIYAFLKGASQLNIDSALERSFFQIFALGVAWLLLISLTKRP